MNWKCAVPCLFTMAAMLTGFFSMLASASGEFVLAAKLIFVSLFLDGIDGALARKLGATSSIGAEMDTFVDMTSFGLAPAFLLYQLHLQQAGFWGLLMTAAIVLSGVYRLSRFRVIDPYRGQRGYVGLPITTAAGWVSSFVIATQLGLVQEEWFTLTDGPLATFFWAATLMMLLLQISRVRYGKPTRQPLIFVPFLILLLLQFMGPRLAVPAALALAAYGFLFAFLSPFFYRRSYPVTEADEEPVELKHS